MLSFKLNCIALLCFPWFVCVWWDWVGGWVLGWLNGCCSLGEGLGVAFRSEVCWQFAFVAACCYSAFGEEWVQQHQQQQWELFFLRFFGQCFLRFPPFQCVCVWCCSAMFLLLWKLFVSCPASAAMAASLCRSRLHFACLTKAISNGFRLCKFNWCPGEWKLISRHPKSTFTRGLRATSGIWHLKYVHMRT